MTGQGRTKSQTTTLIGREIELALVDYLLVVAVSLGLAVKDERHDLPIAGQEPWPVHQNKTKIQMNR